MPVPSKVVWKFRRVFGIRAINAGNIFVKSTVCVCLSVMPVVWNSVLIVPERIRQSSFAIVGNAKEYLLALSVQVLPSCC